MVVWTALITIPSIFISKEDGDLLKAALASDPLLSGITQSVGRQLHSSAWW